MRKLLTFSLVLVKNPGVIDETAHRFKEESSTDTKKYISGSELIGLVGLICK